MLFFGVDGEMSAADISQGGRLIQIGFAAHSTPDGLDECPLPSTFGTLINPGRYEWDARAAAVHGFTKEEIDAAPVASEVDELCIEWLGNQGVVRARSAIAVGFNVGSFDLPHIALVLPKTYTLLSRRTVDLNALCFTLEGRRHEGGTPTWSGWKRMASTYAERIISENSLSLEMAHDAEYDALLHLFAWRYLRSAIHGTPRVMPQTPVHGLSHETQRLCGELLSRVGVDGAIQRTGFTREQLQGWANGGRVPGNHVADRLRSALASIPN